MILSHGNVYENDRQNTVIDALPEDIVKTLQGTPLDVERVIAACDGLAKKAMAGGYDEIAQPLLSYLQIPHETFLSYCEMFTAVCLREKVRRELGGFEEESGDLHRIRRPLGVLLHIAAGNVDALPAYSVVEGLLAGNINLLKLPTGDSGLSIKLLSELIAIEPCLADYIYVFDVPSTELETMKRLADIADAVVIWGGDAAVKAARGMISPCTRLIEWGHKLSFAYAPPTCSDEMLKSLAQDICRTNQLLCSSVQGIYLNTTDMEEVRAFAKRFFEILKRESNEMGKAPSSMRGKNTLRLYTDRLEGKEVLYGDGVSVTVEGDRTLTISYLFRSVWVKPLPKDEIVGAIRPMKGYLQTCALLYEDGQEREDLISLLCCGGVTRITGAQTAVMVKGEGHDGRWALAEYTKVVDVCGGGSEGLLSRSPLEPPSRT